MWDKLRITNYRAHEKNTLRGFFDVTLDTGMTIRGLTHHEKNGRRWVGLPARSFTSDEGAISWSPIVGFEDKEASFQFSDAVIAALDNALGKTPPTGLVDDLFGGKTRISMRSDR